MHKTLTKRGKEKLLLDGYSYVYDRESIDRLTKFWRCAKRGQCKARLHVKGEETKVVGEHNHDPQNNTEMSSQQGSADSSENIPLPSNGFVAVGSSNSVTNIPENNSTFHIQQSSDIPENIPTQPDSTSNQHVSQSQAVYGSSLIAMRGTRSKPGSSQQYEPAPKRLCAAINTDADDIIIEPETTHQQHHQHSVNISDRNRDFGNHSEAEPSVHQHYPPTAIVSLPAQHSSAALYQPECADGNHQQAMEQHHNQESGRKRTHASSNDEENFDFTNALKVTTKRTPSYGDIFSIIESIGFPRQNIVAITKGEFQFQITGQTRSTVIKLADLLRGHGDIHSVELYKSEEVEVLIEWVPFQLKNDHIHSYLEQHHGKVVKPIYPKTFERILLGERVATMNEADLMERPIPRIVFIYGQRLQVSYENQTLSISVEENINRQVENIPSNNPPIKQRIQMTQRFRNVSEQPSSLIQSTHLMDHQSTDGIPSNNHSINGRRSMIESANDVSQYPPSQSTMLLEQQPREILGTSRIPFNNELVNNQMYLSQNTRNIGTNVAQTSSQPSSFMEPLSRGDPGIPSNNHSINGRRSMIQSENDVSQYPPSQSTMLLEQQPREILETSRSPLNNQPINNQMYLSRNTRNIDTNVAQTSSQPSNFMEPLSRDDPEISVANIQSNYPPVMEGMHTHQNASNVPDWLRTSSPTLLKQQYGGQNENILVLGGSQCPRSVVQYNINSKNFLKMPDTNISRKCSSALICGGFVYLMGGRDDDDTTLDSVEILNLHESTLKWEIHQTSMIEGRDLFASTVLNGKIYCVGGMNRWRRLSSVNYYDPEIRKWFESKKMDQPRWDHAMVAARGKLYVFGGFVDGYKATNTAVCFDPNIGEWRNISSMKECRAYACAVLLRNEIFVMGGYDDRYNHLSSVEKYNLDSMEWKKVESMKEERFAPAACLVDHRIYVFGGYNAETVEVYDSHMNSWNTETSMDRERSLLSVVSI